jgi:CheY-like chemotaxis protein
VSATVLVADDDPTIRRLMGVFLKTLGYSAVVVADGEEALRAALADPPDLVISDIHMPELGGLELTRRLREEPALREVPILLFSASIGQADEALWRSVGASGFVVKPPTLAALRETLSRLLS